MTSILVTGGSGSFGNAFVRHCLADPAVKRLVVYSRDELKQYEMEQRFSDERLRFFIGDVRDGERLRRALNGVDIIVHAAALKQIPAAEYNPMECIKTNIHGAENVINAAIDAGTKRVVGLSTDKACNPVNLYGATKLAAEKLFCAANNLSGAMGPNFTVVRYGNVAGSRGSVIPLFREYGRLGKTLPITHPEMTRFWITLEQGCRFVSQAIQTMRGGEIFVPKLASTRIIDLAKQISNHHVITGIRPGEKLHEVMIAAEESRSARDLGDRFVIDTLNRWQGAGKPLPDGFCYSSETSLMPANWQELLAA